MAQIITFAGVAGVNAGSVNSLQAPAATYNQAAGNAILVISNAFNQAPGAISDTAGNSFGTPVLNYVGGNNNNIKAWIVKNCLGSSVNAVTVAYSAAAFATLAYFDISGCDTSSPTDVVTSAATSGAGATTISKTITTVQANEAIITVAFQDSASMISNTPPSGYTGSAINNGYAVYASQVVSSIQTGVTLTWTIGVGAFLDMLVVSLKAPTSGGPVNNNFLTMMGAGT